MARPELERHHAAGPGDWEAWLECHHADSAGVWLMIAKKDGGRSSVSYAEALETAICFGWIDGQKRAHDDAFYLQRFTPRGPRSRWSQVNRAKAEALAAAGRMQPAGAREMQAAQSDGRWAAAYAPQSRASVPSDMQAALDAAPEAAAFFATLTGARRYAFLYRLHNVTTPAARERRIAGYIARLRDGRTLHD